MTLIAFGFCYTLASSLAGQCTISQVLSDAYPDPAAFCTKQVTLANTKLDINGTKNIRFQCFTRQSQAWQ